MIVIDVPAGQWINIYAEAGIAVGTPLILLPYTGLINVNDNETEPPLNTERLFPLPDQITTVQTGVPLGSWAKSRINSQNTRLAVQTGSGDIIVATFDQLTDTPSDKAGSAGFFVAVNPGETALEYIAAPGSPVWGAITGTLSDQTDLQSELDGKLDLTGGALTGALTSSSTITAASFNGVPLTTAGTATDVLAASGVYVPLSGAGGATDFDELIDTPASKVGFGNQYVRVNVGETALEYVASTTSWGAITGTLADQTDLQAELDGKLSLTGGNITGPIISGSTITAFSFNGVPLTAAGSAANFLTEAGTYVPNAVGGTFDELTDTPASKAGAANLFVRVNAGETALEYAANAVSTAWGDITGTLAAQADLQSALNGKLSLAGGALTGPVTSTSTITATTFNAVPLTAAGSAANFLTEAGTYVATAPGGAPTLILKNAYLFDQTIPSSDTNTRVTFNNQVTTDVTITNADGMVTFNTAGTYLIQMRVQLANSDLVNNANFRFRALSAGLIEEDGVVPYNLPPGTGSYDLVVSDFIITVSALDTLWWDMDLDSLASGGSGGFLVTHTTIALGPWSPSGSSKLTIYKY